MSGTSLDGVDLACCEFSYDKPKWQYKIVAAQSFPYVKNMLKDLKSSVTADATNLMHLDVALGWWYGQIVADFIEKHQLKPDFIASHGHTVFHQPAQGLTTQIGNGWAIHQKTRLPVINDFRSKDVSLGGQGAPLVPIGDRLLFPEFDYCLNLGGIANISFEHQSRRVAYDIAPCNMVFNRLAQKLGFEYDENGQSAAQGFLQKDLLELLNSWEYYRKDFPKSLGYEQVNNEVFPMIDSSQYPIEDVMASYASHLGKQIASAIQLKKARILVTGGGAYNRFLIQQIEKNLPEDARLILPDRQLIDFKEALVFAFLGVLRWRGEVNCLSSVTGASEDNCGGVIYQ